MNLEESPIGELIKELQCYARNPDGGLPASAYEIAENLEYIPLPDDGDEADSGAGIFYAWQGNCSMYFKGLRDGKPSQGGGGPAFRTLDWGRRIRDLRNGGLPLVAAIDELYEQVGVDLDSLSMAYRRLPVSISGLTPVDHGYGFSQAFEEAIDHLAVGELPSEAVLGAIRDNVVFEAGDLWDDREVGWWGLGQEDRPNPSHRDGEEREIKVAHIYLTQDRMMAADPQLTEKRARKLAVEEVAASFVDSSADRTGYRKELAALKRAARDRLQEKNEGRFSWYENLKALGLPPES